jgi:hypothetical protein
MLWRRSLVKIQSTTNCGYHLRAYAAQGLCLHGLLLISAFPTRSADLLAAAPDVIIVGNAISGAFKPPLRWFPG